MSVPSLKWMSMAPPVWMVAWSMRTFHASWVREIFSLFVHERADGLFSCPEIVAAAK
ncbi:hypothetical protein [Propionimicrobium lymphophilum]|uniref:hypothetical protein n=1 Tax=Propionimicrobium lymphophilum TaxID=33012 RepID=UPI00288C5326|nr:hypothetical protein [Propionimicrobium lymphophilum]